MVTADDVVKVGASVEVGLAAGDGAFEEHGRLKRRRDGERRLVVACVECIKHGVRVCDVLRVALGAAHRLRRRRFGDAGGRGGGGGGYRARGG